MLTALRLFARDGYEATSVSNITGELGMTKGALYKHYRNKRDIFDSIVERMFEIDIERARKHKVPEETFDKSPPSYHHIAMEQIKDFSKSQFSFWTEDEFACDFRKMLTLEQYRSPEIMELYQECLVSGPVNYMEDLFREMGDQNLFNKSDTKQLAIEFYAPFYLLVSISDTSPDNKEVVRLFSEHIERFIENNIASQKGV